MRFLYDGWIKLILTKAEFFRYTYLLTSTYSDLGSKIQATMWMNYIKRQQCLNFLTTRLQKGTRVFNHTHTETHRHD